MVEAKTAASMAGLVAMRGDFATARELIAQSSRMLAELGLGFSVAVNRQMSGMIELLAEDYAAAEEEFRRGFDALKELGDKGYLPSFAAFLGEALYEQGRLEDADRFTKMSEELFAADDATQKADWGPVRSKLMARAGDHAGAEALAREVVAIAAGTDEIFDHADALMDLADVLRIIGKAEEAAATAQEALALLEKKGVVPAIAHVKHFVATLAA